jgi:hypothetical protein
MSSVAGKDYAAEPALKCIPVPFFLDVIEDGTRLQAESWTGSIPSTIDEVNRLFKRRGIFYQMQSMRIQWVGDPGLHHGVVKPALEVLSDQRLVGAAAEFSAALAHLRAGSLKDREDAIDEAAKSVESAMKAVCDAHGIQRKGNETADPLFKLLDDGGVAVHEADKPDDLQTCRNSSSSVLLGSGQLLL